MGFRKDSFAKIWSVEPGKGKFTKVNLSVSRKNQQTGQYETEFSDFCMFIGTAHTRAALLKKGDRIKLGDVDVTTRYDKANNRKYIDFKVFSFDMAEAVNGGGYPDPVNHVENQVEENSVESDDGNNLPF